MEGANIRAGIVFQKVGATTSSAPRLNPFAFREATTLFMSKYFGRRAWETPASRSDHYHLKSKQGFYFPRTEHVFYKHLNIVGGMGL